MKHILCAFRNLQSDMLEEIHDYAGKHDWSLEITGLRIPPGWFGDGVMTDYIPLEKLRNVRGIEHIPVVEEYELLRKAKPWEMWKAVRGYGHLNKNWYVLKDEDNGYLAEGPCPADVNSGQFESWKKMGDIKGAFFGHDHLNDFSGYVDGIYLAQHKTAGFRAYTDGCRSCVRLLTLDENDLGSFEQELRHFKEFGLECECF